MKLSIGKTLIGALVGLQLVAVSIFISSSYMSTEEALVDHARILMEEAAGNVIQSSKGLLSPPQDAARLTQRLIKNGTLNMSDRATVANYMLEQLRVNDQLSGIYFATPSGDFFNVQHSSLKQPGGFKRKVITNRGGVRAVEITWYDSTLNVIAVETDPKDRYDPRQRPWYIKAMTERAAIWTDPYIFFTAKEPGVTGAIPVYDDTGHIIAVVGVDVKITRFSQFLKSNLSTEDGGAFIVSTDGTLVAMPELAGGVPLEGTDKKPVLPNISTTGSQATLAASEALKSAQNKASSGSVFTSFVVDGRPYFAMSSSFGDLPWSVGLYGSEEHYLGVLKDNQVFNLLFALGIGLVSCVIGFVIAQKISKPIKQLGQTAHSVSREGLDAKIVNVSESPFLEIQDTSKAFISMMHDLKAAKQTKEALSEFVSSMTHELRTPMTAIVGFSQILQSNTSDKLSDQQREFVDIILQSATHQLELINQVLDLAKIKSGTSAPELRPVNPHETIQLCLNFIKFLAEMKRVTVELNCAAGAAQNVMADQRHLKQVMLNLISNAIKFNHDAGHVSVLCEAGAPGMLKISVTDNGPGIPRERVGEIFKAFNRLDFETTAVEGTGIGLSITKELVERMGGTIGVESYPGEGATFSIELPIAEDED